MTEVKELYIVEFYHNYEPGHNKIFINYEKANDAYEKINGWDVITLNKCNMNKDECFELGDNSEELKRK